jgi:hypothetical protein
MKPLRHASSHVCACVRALAEAQHSKATAAPASHDFLMEPVEIDSKIVTLPSPLNRLDIEPNLNSISDHTSVGSPSA